MAGKGLFSLILLGGAAALMLGGKSSSKKKLPPPVPKPTGTGEPGGSEGIVDKCKKFIDAIFVETMTPDELPIQGVAITETILPIMTSLAKDVASHDVLVLNALEEIAPGCMWNKKEDDWYYFNNTKAEGKVAIVIAALYHLADQVLGMEGGTTADLYQNPQVLLHGVSTKPKKAESEPLQGKLKFSRTPDRERPDRERPDRERPDRDRDRPKGGLPRKGMGQDEGAYVGGAWGPGYWPHANIFVGYNHFIQALKDLGYNSGNWDNNVLKPQTKAAVAAFQKDWNKIIQAGLMQGESPLSKSGLLDLATIEALISANLAQEKLKKPWKSLVPQMHGVNGLKN